MADEARLGDFYSLKGLTDYDIKKISDGLLHVAGAERYEPFYYLWMKFMWDSEGGKLTSDQCKERTGWSSWSSFVNDKDGLAALLDKLTKDGKIPQGT